MKQTLFEKGSEWRKWDLHIHSNASDGSSTPKEIIEEAKIKGISVIALTDHHTVKNIDEIKTIGEQEGIKVISGIEFRTEYGEKSVHIIGLFPDYHKEQKLDSKALNELILCPLNLSETRIIAKGRETNSTLSDEAAFKAGMFLLQVDFREAADLIHSYGGLVSVHAGSKANTIEEMKHQGNSQKNVQFLYDSLGVVKDDLLKNHVDICEIRKENDSEDFYYGRFGLPSITASDAHDKDTIGEKFTWIKADPTFQGLKQIKYEPKERVAIQLNIPKEKAGYQVIEKLELKHPDISNENIPLNPNLNSIIGGRSTGKSIILGAIAKKFNNGIRIKDNAKYDEFVKDISANLKVYWKDGIENNSREVEYFSQGHMFTLAKNRDALNALIQSILKQKGKGVHISNYLDFCNDNRIKILDIVNKIFSLNKNQKEKEKERREKGDKKGIEDEIIKLKTDISKVNQAVLSQEEINEFNSLREETEKLKTTITNFGTELEKIEQLKYKELIKQSIEIEILSLSEESKLFITSKYQNLKNEFTQRWITELNALVDVINKKIEESSKKLKDLEEKDLFKKGIKELLDNQQHKELDDRLKIQERKLGEITILLNEENEIIKQLGQNIKLLKESHNEYYTKLIGIINELSISYDGLSITAFAKFRGKEYRNLLEGSLNLRGDENYTIASFEYENDEQYQKHIEGLFNKLFMNQITLKAGYTNQTLIQNLYADNFYEISYDLQYDNDSFDQMSEGKMAFVILKLLLDFSEKDCPILIDQPEDDLDNRAIYDELVEYIKNKKKDRQIIVATHNPNIVVGADSELVIIANQHGKKCENDNNIKFQYIGGSIEHTFKPKEEHHGCILTSQGIKEHICQILEGGEPAFIHRENKYEINKA